MTSGAASDHETPPRLTKARLEEYLDLRENRLRLQREAAALEAREKSIAEELLEHVRRHGGKTRTVLTCGFVLAIKMAKGFVRWKDHYVEATSFEDAEKRIAEAPPSERLSVERA